MSSHDNFGPANSPFFNPPPPSSSSNGSLSVLSTPRRWREQPPPDSSIGVDPDQIVGKVLVHIRRSLTHPAVTFHFADNTTYQVRVYGYDPVHRGIPKELETNSVLLPLFKPPAGQIDVHLTVTHARMVSLKDTAHQWSEKAESRWNVEHLAFALKFAEEPGWHCVWATMAEYDGDFGPCTFRSFDDVYLAELRPSPRKRKFPQKQGRNIRKPGLGTGISLGR